MNKQDFINILKQPVNITAADLKKLEELAGSFPYCQAAHILIAKGNFDYGSMLAEQKVKKAALYASDRKNLRNFIHIKSIVPAADSILTLTNNNAIEKIEPVTDSKNAEISEKTLEVSNDDPALNSQTSSPIGTKNPSDENISTVQNSENKTNRATSIIDNFLSSYITSEEILPEQQITSDIQKNLAELRRNREKFYNAGKEPDSLREEEPDEAFTKNPNNVLSKDPSDQPIKFSSSGSKPVISASDIVQENKLISESELLLGYLEFLKSDRSLFKRDPDKINQIIDKFIKEDPAISPLKPNEIKENLKDLTEPVVQKRKQPVSETFAVILEKQGKFGKSIEIYEELILKYPEKKAYFAGRIEELKKQLNK